MRCQVQSDMDCLKRIALDHYTAYDSQSAANSSAAFLCKPKLLFGSSQKQQTWEESLELLNGLTHAAVALALLAVSLGLPQLRIHLLQLLG